MNPSDRMLLDATQAGITASNLFSNNPNQNWRQNNKKTGKPACENTGLRFTAQTSIAASYGYLQVTLPTSYNQRDPSNPIGTITLAHPNPSYLFDTPANLAAGWSSLPIGTAYLTKLFVSSNSSNSPAVESYVGLLGTWKNAVMMYNGKGDAAIQYQMNVFNFVPKYDPIKNTPFF